MDSSYADYIISKFSKFLDPFSLSEISTERLCYPISYATEEMVRGWEGINQGKDVEDDLLIRQSLLKDLPGFEKASVSQAYINDGAAHILRNRTRESLIQLLGMPKIGKSTLLKKIALLAAQEMKQDPNSPAPILINLETTFKSEVTSKMELIESCFSQYEEFEAYLRDKFFQGKVILLLDELDKVEEMNQKLLEWLKALKTFVKLPLCVICSRYSGYLEMENIPVMYVDIYPMKLQISMAQNMLSELQFERFVEAITGNCGHFSELASTPYMFSLLLEMFRWGKVGTVDPITRGKLYSLAVKHLLSGKDSPQVLQAFEAIATDLLIRNSKIFNYIDVKNLGLEFLWSDIKTSQILLVQWDNKKNSLGYSSDDDAFKESIDESGIGEVKESLMLLTFKNLSRKDSTPQWVANSKESYLNYQFARKCIDRHANGTYNEYYRFLHLRIIEVLAAQNYLNQIEDSLLHSTAGFLMESSAFQKSFTNCFPGNFLFCRRFREVLLLFSSLCSENIFENLIKYLLNKETTEHCFLAEKLLKERGMQPSHRPLINKLKQDKLEMSKKAFSKSYFHPSAAIQKICKNEAVESGLSEADMINIVNKNIDFVLKNSHWLYLKQLNHLGKDINMKIIKSVFNKLLDVSTDILSNATRPTSYKAIAHKVFLSIFLSIFDKGDLTHQQNSNFTSPVSSCGTPNKYDNEKNTEESTIRISFDKIKIPRTENPMIEKIGNTNKLISILIDLLQICPAIDLNLIVRTLLTLGCSISQIHIGLAARFACLEDKYERKEILIVLRLLGFVTQHTVDIPLVCLGLDKELQMLAKDILKLLNVDKLKKHAVNVLVKDDSPQIKLLLALRALGFTRKQDLDPEVLYFLAQFVDHYSLELRLEAIKSLYSLAKGSKPIENNETRKSLAVVPHVLKDRIKLLRYDTNLRAFSLKCLVSLWIILDKGKEDSNATQMFHILVKEQIGTSYLVGSMNSIFTLIKDFLQKSDIEREAAWVCLYKMSPVLEFLGLDDWSFVLSEIKAGLFRENLCEIKSILKLLLVNPVTSEDKSELLSIILNTSFEQKPILVRYIAKLLSNWHEIISLKFLLPSSFQITAELCKVLAKLRLLIDYFYNCVDNNSTELFGELKQLHNWYKSMVNQVAENMQWPSKVFPHKNQLLDISADPSFFKEDSIPEISCSYTDLDASFPKHSMDSANTDLEEQPPPIDLCHQLILAGVRSEGLKHWVLWYLKHSELIQHISIAAESWNNISYNKDFYNPHVENVLIKFLNTHPEEIAKIALELRFKSDGFCVKIVGSMIKGDIKSDIGYRAAVMCMELNSPMPLEEVYKMISVCNRDPVHMYFLHSCAAKVMENLTIGSETQLNSVLKALVSTGCSLFVQPIWNYWMKAILQSPGYLLSPHPLSILENCSSWDCKFLMSRARILGLVPVDQYHKETGSSMSTKKL